MIDLDIYFPDKDIYSSLENDMFSEILEEDPIKLINSSFNHMKSVENASLLLSLELSNIISEESSFFRRIWDFIINIIKKIISAISNFFKAMIIFFKNMFINKKIDKIKQLDELPALRKARIVDEIYDRIINNKFNITGTKNDIFSTESSDNSKKLSIVRPNFENNYMNTIERVYKNDFLLQFRKITVNIDEISSLITNTSSNILSDKIDNIREISKDYKEKMYEIVSILKDIKDSNIIVINSDNCKDIIYYCISKEMKTRWNDVELTKSLDPKTCNRMLNVLIQSIKKIKIKSEVYSQLKKLPESLNSTITSTNLLFSEFFSCIRLHISSEDIKFKILNLAIELMEKENK